MPLPYIIVNFAEPGRDDEKLIKVTRKLLVVDAQPYYLSSSYNSGAKQYLPFLMMRGFKENPSLVGIPSIYEPQELASYFNLETEPRALLKFLPSLLKPSELNQTVIKRPVRNGEFNYKRLPTKESLIISSRLSRGSIDDSVGYTPELLAELGLNKAEIKQALDPLTLEAKPCKTFNLPNPFSAEGEIDYDIGDKVAAAIDQINYWLAKQGAQVAGIVAHPKCLDDFAKCDAIWKKAAQDVTKPLSMAALQVVQAKQILRSHYTKGSRCNRFWSGVWGRNHIPAIDKILKETHSDLESLLNSLTSAIHASGKNIKDDADLMTCIYFIRQKTLKGVDNSVHDEIKTQEDGHQERTSLLDGYDYYSCPKLG